MKVWTAPKWLSDERPYVVIHTDATLRKPVELRAFECPHIPDGKISKRIAPEYPHDLFRAALAIQSDPTVHCLLVDDPQDPENVPRVDLVEWVERARTRIQNQKPICLAPLTATQCPCGKAPCCRQNPRTRVEEGLDTLEQMLENTHQIDEFINREFAFLSPRDRTILHAWSTHNNLDKKKGLMTDEALMEKFQVSRSTLIRIRNKAKAENATAFRTLTIARDRAKITHGYTVDDRTAARDADD